MKQQQFVEQQRPLWDEFQQLLEQMAKPPRRRNAATLVELPALYRRVCADYALARHRRYSTGLVDQLHDLVMRGHSVLYRRKSIWLWRIISFFLVGFPATLRRHARMFWLATALFYLPFVLFGSLAYYDDEIIYSLMPPEQVRNMEYMYDPSNPVPGREEQRESTTNFGMFGIYIYNNIGIGFRAFATGMLAGTGSVVTLLYNGTVIGAVAGHLTQIGFSDTFWPFVAGHSAFELTAICICGAAGLLLGWAILAPGRRRRIDALKAAALEAVKLIMGAATLLFFAAFIEAFWSSNGSIDSTLKYAVGIALWVLLALYLTFAGRRYDAA
jgi:uncharacterized membrane protein SpoIIM required for sporulation